MNPFVSIILPTYRDAKRISLAIQSVQQQTFTNWELVIVDDGLYDEVKAVMLHCAEKDPRIIYLGDRGNTGIQKSLNQGLAKARGKYIARIDDDDEWIDPDKLAKQVEFLETHPDYVLVGTHAIICDENGRELGRYTMPQDDQSIRARILMKNCFLHPTILARREAIINVGNYSESEAVKHVEDYELWLRLGSVGKITNLDIFAVQLTIHSDSLTFQNRIVQTKRTARVARQYRKKYPNFFIGQVILLIRIIGFMVLKYVPLPNSLLYKIQKWYKEL